VTEPYDSPGAPKLGVSGLVGAYVPGPPSAQRVVVRWLDLLTAAQELDDRFNPDQEAYLSAFAFPKLEYIAHVRRHGSPRGYTGPASSPWLWFDIDRPDNLDEARRDALTLARFLMQRYPKLEAGIGCWFTGLKGFHLCIECLPGNRPDPLVPATAKRLALALASAVGVRIDPSIYNHQRIFRLPNSRHAESGLRKIPLALPELELPTERILELAREPRGRPLPEANDLSAGDGLEDDWNAALDAVKRSGTVGVAGRRVPPADTPVVPKFVRDFIGFSDVQDPGRAVTLWRCAAALAEAGTPPAVIWGLLEESALKTGLPPDEVSRQIRTGIAHGTCQRREGGAT
jgi:hypothetical protein